MVSGELHIRMARLDDAQELLSIYAPYVAKTAISFEYALPSLREFIGRMERLLEKYPYLVAESDGKLVGYAYAGPFNPRPAYDRAAELTVYVAESMKRKGIGKRLYMALETVLAAQNILNAYACIAYPEEEDEYLSKNSVGFHQALGYQMVGKFSRCGFKFHRWYGVVWMEKHLGEHHADQPTVIHVRDLPDAIWSALSIAR